MKRRRFSSFIQNVVVLPRLLHEHPILALQPWHYQFSRVYIQRTSSVERENGEMDEEEHEVYGGEIPDEGEMEGDMDAHNADVDMATNDDDAVKVLSLYLHSFFQF